MGDKKKSKLETAKELGKDFLFNSQEGKALRAVGRHLPGVYTAGKLLDTAKKIKEDWDAAEAGGFSSKAEARSYLDDTKKSSKEKKLDLEGVAKMSKAKWEREKRKAGVKD